MVVMVLVAVVTTVMVLLMVVAVAAVLLVAMVWMMTLRGVDADFACVQLVRCTRRQMVLSILERCLNCGI